MDTWEGWLRARAIMSYVLTNWRDEQQRFRFSLPSCGIEWYIAIYCMLICMCRVILLCAPQWAVVTLVTGATPGGTDWSAHDGGTATAHCVTILMSCHTVTLLSTSTIVITTLSLHPPARGMGHGTMELCIVWQTYVQKKGRRYFDHWIHVLMQTVKE